MKFSWVFLLFAMSSQVNAAELSTSFSLLARPNFAARATCGYDNLYVGIGATRYHDSESEKQNEVGVLGSLGWQQIFLQQDKFGLEFKTFVGVEQFRDKSQQMNYRRVPLVGAELGLARFSQDLPPKYPSIPTLAMTFGLGFEGRLLDQGNIYAGDTKITPGIVYIFLSTSGIFH